jgi:hypothetical protein
MPLHIRLIYEKELEGVEQTYGQYQYYISVFCLALDLVRKYRINPTPKWELWM